MAVQTEHVLFRPEYRASKQATTLEPVEQQQLSHAFTDTPSVFRLLSTVRSRRFGMGYRYEPFLINPQIKAHFQQWHKGEPDPYANGSR